MGRASRLGALAAVWGSVFVAGVGLAAFVMAPIIAPGPAIAASVPGGPMDLEATVNDDPAVAVKA